MEKTFLLILMFSSLFAFAQSTDIQVGDIVCVNGADTTFVHPEDYHSGAIGVVFYVNGKHGWIIDLYDSSDNVNGDTFCFSEEQEDVEGVINYGHPRHKPGWPGDDIGCIYDFKGYSNTQALRSQGNSTTYPAAWAVDLEHDWYLPAIGQLNILSSQMPYVIPSIETAGGNAPNTSRYHWYWSSSEFVDPSGNACCAWALYGTGYLCALQRYYKSDSGHQMHVRAIRNF